MRVDAKALLDRLGKSDFTYREFVDRFSELELWPLFEALLRDERLALLDDASHSSTAPSSGGATAPVAGQPAARETSHQPFAALFSRYEAGNTETGRPAHSTPPAADMPPQDVRMLLRQLSELQRKGEL